VRFNQSNLETTDFQIILAGTSNILQKQKATSCLEDSNVKELILKHS
jgi:hypothetical protein